MRSKIFAVFIFIIVSQLGCKPNGEGDGGTVGPCVHIYKEAILHIESVNNAQTGSLIPTIILSKITLDTVKIDPMWLTIVSKNVVFYDSTLICNVHCSFGMDSREYRFTVSANGYADTTITCFPIYIMNQGGCPSSSDGGLRIRFTMRPL
jgi:hypothetical protein